MATAPCHYQALFIVHSHNKLFIVSSCTKICSHTVYTTTLATVIPVSWLFLFELVNTLLWHPKIQMQKILLTSLVHRKPYLRAWIINTWQKKSLRLIASNFRSIQVFLSSTVQLQHWRSYCKVIKFQFINIWVLNQTQAIFTSNSLWILFRETQASVSPFKTQGKAFNGAISMFNRAILVKTWK